MDQVGHSLQRIRYPGNGRDVAVLQFDGQVVQSGRALEYLGHSAFIDLHPTLHLIYSL